ncbi:hypothetical protein [Archangium lipolyticum]|uniref:hypothetical protein n=1 Tax=Archangium lipolyticum TaxID=2970465 RepID=UPI00214A3A3C|nr:hypothetical protein [Archangium lipolyticum]
MPSFRAPLPALLVPLLLLASGCATFTSHRQFPPEGCQVVSWWIKALGAQPSRP